MLNTLDTQSRRLLDAYPAIFLACHRQHVRDDESGRTLTEHQASVLDHLSAEKAITVSRLAEHMGVGRSTMSIIVGKLVRQGFIARERNRKDRRTAGLRLTRAGMRIKEQNSILDPDLMREMFGLMRPHELESALQGVECLAKYARMLLRRRKRERD